ncbi:RWD domain-containing protein 2A [Ischnura elegans]|uniref:RWD domain-containing protein 2A n=1 Tax=Ischnura elegans TaxID=197161 RepID=UPI001ED871CA|nr:RWD domain-containing protein 2A [Ischnura elegans]
MSLSKENVAQKESESCVSFNEIEDQAIISVDRSELEEMLRQQLAEYEMLQSMFSNAGEMCMDDYSVIADINEFLDGHCSSFPQCLDFTVNLYLEKIKLEVCITLPHEYPAVEPDIYVRSDKLSRDQQHNLNKDLEEFVKTLDRGETCLLQAISWLQENYENYVEVNEAVVPAQSTDSEDKQFARFWIYSHHIFSKVKRREILGLASEYDITGFCLPGRPGIICIEGLSRNCEEWWLKIKHMNWKKIMCRKKEIEPISNQEECNALRKFSSFEEVSFMGDKNSSKGRNGHMDMGALLRYLDNHQCAHAFRDYFGIDGKLCDTAASH